MGQKTHPFGLRLGIINEWRSKWFASKRAFTKQLHEDLEIRKIVKERFAASGISTVEIERSYNRIRVTIHTAKPGMVIGKGGAGIDALRKELEALTGKQVLLNIEEIRYPELDAQLVAENVVQQIEKRVSHKRAMKLAISRALKAGALGIKIECSGRLAGADIARSEWYREGRVPLQTLRANIDYGTAEALIKYGRIGVKTWIYKGDVIPGVSAGPGKPEHKKS
ncbi:MAG: 30S ribosomal protein S3 [Coprothermobacterota bacterium]|nr:30S ribosomal protein S3 [Caldisericota bacterium]MDI6869156.1 30S ribosomal protein S3 [Coprothermobacterota bacterium]